MESREIVTDCLSTVEGKRFTFLCYGRNDSISRSLIKYKQWEIQLMEIAEKYLTPESVILDIGANIGTWTVGLAMYNRKIYSFEPLYQSFLALCGNVFINKIENNVTVFNCAVTDNMENQLTMVVHDNNNLGGSFVKLADENDKKIKSITIDSLQLDKVNFIKLDVEGHEINVLKGGEQTIKKNRPVIIFESWGNQDLKEQREKLITYLYELNYNVYHINSADYLALPKPI